MVFSCWGLPFCNQEDSVRSTLLKLYIPCEQETVRTHIPIPFFLIVQIDSPLKTSWGKIISALPTPPTTHFLHFPWDLSAPYPNCCKTGEGVPPCVLNFTRNYPEPNILFRAKHQEILCFPWGPVLFSHSLRGTEVYSFSFWSSRCSQGSGSPCRIHARPYYFMSVYLPHWAVYTSFCAVPDPTTLLWSL